MCGAADASESLDRLLGSLTDARAALTAAERERDEFKALWELEAESKTRFAHRWQAAEAALADAQRERDELVLAHEKAGQEFEARMRMFRRAEAAEARVETLQAALELVATPRRADGTYNRSREACEQLARAALREQHRETPPPENTEARPTEPRSGRAGGEA